MGTVHIHLAVLHLGKLTIYNFIVLIISQNMLAIGIMLFINYMTSINNYCFMQSIINSITA